MVTAVKYFTKRKIRNTSNLIGQIKLKSLIQTSLLQLNIYLNKFIHLLNGCYVVYTKNLNHVDMENIKPVFVLPVSCLEIYSTVAYCVLQPSKCSWIGGSKETYWESAWNCKLMSPQKYNLKLSNGRFKKVRLIKNIVFTDTSLQNWKW